MVTNRLGCLSVLVLLLALSNSVTSRDLRMKREIHRNATNTTEGHGTANVAQDLNGTTVKPLALGTSPVIEMKTGKPDVNNSAVSMDHHDASDLNHTQQANKTSESGNHTAGTENVTTQPPAGIERTLHTQSSVTKDSNGHTSQTGSSAHTFPPTSVPGKVMNTTASTTNATKLTTALSPTTHSTTTKQTSTTGKVVPCSTSSSHRDGLVSRCLIAIASMAALTTIFVISTICLATKLSSYRYRNRARLLQETEMVCISALMNDTDHPVPKPRHPRSNGALIPCSEDGDLDGDNLTLNSFLPDSEGMI
ncbi:P-selectin glycoprotein ligand 1 [Paramisgurnus dabryanus]|uniref:P-selectin glycoprotein ligand 1 n=1 Tax=Paramisgurnus dabryanus TaxID=90735 RepID=UPI003CCF7001